MRPQCAGIVVFAATLLGGAVAQARSVDIDPAQLGTPMVSPSVDVTVGGQPSALGVACDLGIENITRDPVLEWRFSAAEPSVRISIAGARAAVRDFDGRWWCSDANGEITLAARVGAYRLYAVSNESRATVSLRFESPARIREVVDAARDRAPQLTIGATSRPNPIVRALGVVRAGEARDLGLCVGGRATFAPIARVVVADDRSALHVAERARRTIGGRAARLQLVDDAGRCMPDGAVKAGTYALWAEVEVDRPPGAIWVELDDASRPIEWADAPTVDLTNTTEPLVDDGKIERPAPHPTRAVTACKPVAAAPSFYLDTAIEQRGVELVMVWSRRPRWFLIDGPGVSRCSADGGPLVFDAVAGRYAVWAGGDAGDDFTLLIHRTGTTIDPLTIYARPSADLTLADRALPHFFPFFELDADPAVAQGQASALFAAAPPRIFAWARAALGTDAAAPRADEPVIVLAVAGDHADVLSRAGQRLRVSTAALTIVPPRSIHMPADAPASPRAPVAPVGTAPAQLSQSLDAAPATRAAAPPASVAPPAPAPPAAHWDDTPLVNDFSDAADAGERAPAPPPRRAFELDAAFPIRSEVDVGSTHDTGESLTFAAAAVWRIGDRLQIGGELASDSWRNTGTAQRGGTSELVTGGAVVRYDLITGGFRFDVRAGVGLGVSALTGKFAVYNLFTMQGMQQSDSIGNATGLAETYELGLGFSRAIEGSWSVVGALTYRGARMHHDLSVTSGTGEPLTATVIDLDGIDASVGVAFGF